MPTRQPLRSSRPAPPTSTAAAGAQPDPQRGPRPVNSFQRETAAASRRSQAAHSPTKRPLNSSARKTPIGRTGERCDTLPPCHGILPYSMPMIRNAWTDTHGASIACCA
jgi:hypothetical protein